MFACVKTHVADLHTCPHVHIPPVSMDRTVDSSPGMPLNFHCNQHDVLYTHQTTQPLVPSHMWTPVHPPPHLQPPLLCCLPHALAQGGVLGVLEAEPLPPVVQLILLTLWSFLLVLQCLFTCSCSALQPMATSFVLPGALTHATCLLHAHVDTDRLPQLHAHTPVYTLISTCTHADSVLPKVGPLHDLASLPGGAQSTRPPLLTPGVPTLQLKTIGMVVPTSGHQLDLLGAKPLCPKQ